jgi:UDP-GlcNAc:undecaprenyl-phosphate GlcNAc-1-phosphate transferase
MFLVYFSIFFAAFLLSRALFKPAISLSYKVGAIDTPNNRKIHTRATARGGGLTFFVAFTVILLMLPIDVNFKVALALGGTTTFLIGFWDDATSLSPFQKLAGQFLGAAVYIILRGEMGIAEGAMILFWLVFIGNSINLSDGIDGLASGITASQSICLAALGLIVGNLDVWVCSLLLLGAILGFLPRNFPNAKIFMGDGGALFLGFTLGALSSDLVANAPSPILVLSVYLIFRMPNADAVSSFVRRAIKRKNPFSADRGHFHHRLLDWGFSKECTALALTTATLFLGFVGVLIALMGI